MSAARRFATGLESPLKTGIGLLAAGLVLAVMLWGAADAVYARQARDAHRSASRPTTAATCLSDAHRGRRAHRGDDRRTLARRCSKARTAAGVSEASSSVRSQPDSSAGAAPSAPGAPSSAPAQSVDGSGPSDPISLEGLPSEPEGSPVAPVESPPGLPEGSPGPSESSPEGSPEETPPGLPEGSPAPPEGSLGPLENSPGPFESTPEAPPEGGSGSTEPASPFRFFGSSSIWNGPLPANAPLDPTSTAVVSAFDALIAAEEQAKVGGPWINASAYSIPIYTVPADQPTVPVKLDYSQPIPALQSAWDAVPLPPTAKPAFGSDHSLVVWQPSTGRMWEFWRLAHDTTGWYASWGGAMQHVWSNPGVFGPEAWPGAKPWWGASASSLSGVGGLISLEDLKLGHINHALSILIPEVRADVYASPAQRTDGKSTDPLALPEGAHLRLNPNLDLASLHLPKLTLMIAEAAQRYGIYVKDRGGVVTFQAQDPIPTGTNPYTGPDGYFEGRSPRKLLASFPWSELQLLKMELHTSTAAG